MTALFRTERYRDSSFIFFSLFAELITKEHRV